MKLVKSIRLMALYGTALGLAACVTTPPGPPPEIVRLQHEQDRLHADPRIVANGGTELNNADAALATLAQNAHALDARQYEQGVYLTDKLLQVAEASALARAAERRGEELGIERDRLSSSVTVSTHTGAPMRPASGETVIVEHASVPDARARLFALQGQLIGSESKVDERGLVVRLADFNFQPGEARLTSTGERSLASLAHALESDPRASARIVAFDDRGMPGERAAVVRDYLDARGVDSSRIDLRSARSGEAPANGVLIVVRE